MKYYTQTDETVPDFDELSTPDLLRVMRACQNCTDCTTCRYYNAEKCPGKCTSV